MAKKPFKSHSFRVFLDVWNQNQKCTTPSIHHAMAAWLEESRGLGRQRLLMTAFRGSGKSTLVALYLTWLFTQDPDMRALLLAADSSLAIKMANNIRKIIQSHPFSSTLRPKNPDQWAADRFTVNRTKELRDPSILALGISANITGCRADIIVYDDVEVPNTCNTALKRQDLRERLMESNFILVPGGTQLYIGTPHTYFSIYAEEPRTEIDEERTFLEGYHRYKKPVLNQRGQSVWPERFSMKEIEYLRAQSGPNKFAAQMMLDPVNIIDGRLDKELLNFYYGRLEYREVQQQISLSLAGENIVSCSAWWDPAFGSAKGDNSVLAIVFTDDRGNYYLHHIEYIKIEPKPDEDEASLQCHIVSDLAKKYYVPAIMVETNGIGKFLPAILRQNLAKKNVPCAVIEKTSMQAKDMRILESFDAILAARSLYVNESVRQTPFLSEMMEWQPEGKSKDDGLDAVAGALSCEPIRLKRFYHNIRINWKNGGQSYQGETNFDV